MLMLILLHLDARWHLPPLHPILVNFTAALVPVSVITDILGRVLKRPSLTATGWWTLVFATLITPFTGLAGWLWLQQMPDMNAQPMGLHKWLGTALAGVLFVLLWWRSTSFRHNVAPSRSYLTLAAIVLAAVILQGHVGGMMSFGTQEEALATSAAASHGSTHVTSPSTTPAHSGVLEWKDHLDLKD
jgi:uncharacterized membrane protein